LDSKWAKTGQLADILDTYSAIGAASSTQRNNQFLGTQAQGRSQDYRSVSAKNDTNNFKVSDTVQVSKKPDIAEKNLFQMWT
jgi:hypothetical protein